MRTYRLGSSPLVFTPGFVAYLRNAVKTQKRWAFKCVRDGWGLSTKAAHALLIDGTYTVEGSVVVLTVKGESAPKEAPCAT